MTDFIAGGLWDCAKFMGSFKQLMGTRKGMLKIKVDWGEASMGRWRGGLI